MLIFGKVVLRNHFPKSVLTKSIRDDSAHSGREPCKIEDVDEHFFDGHFNMKKYVMAIIPGIVLPQCQYKFDVKTAKANKERYFSRSEVESGLQMCQY